VGLGGVEVMVLVLVRDGVVLVRIDNEIYRNGGFWWRKCGCGIDVGYGLPNLRTIGVLKAVELGLYF
jgi:hypothetical protein